MLDLERRDDLGGRQRWQGHLPDDDLRAADGRDDGIAFGPGGGQGGVDGLRKLSVVQIVLDTAEPAPDHEFDSTAPLQHQSLDGAMAHIETHHPLTQDVEYHALAGRTTIFDVSNVSPRLPRKTGPSAEKWRPAKRARSPGGQLVAADPRWRRRKGGGGPALQPQPRHAFRPPGLGGPAALWRGGGAGLPRGCAGRAGGGSPPPASPGPLSPPASAWVPDRSGKGRGRASPRGVRVDLPG